MALSDGLVVHNDTWAWERQLDAERAIDGAAECPNCGATLFVEDCDTLLSCEGCGWRGRLTTAIEEPS